MSLRGKNVARTADAGKQRAAFGSAMLRRLLMKRLAQVALLGLVLCGCNGWPKAAQLEDAERKPEPYPTYSAGQPQAPDTLALEGRP